MNYFIGTSFYNDEVLFEGELRQFLMITDQEHAKALLIRGDISIVSVNIKIRKT